MLTGIDIKLFMAINKGCANPLLDRAMPLVTLIGGGELVFALSLILIIFAKKDKKISGVLLFAGLTITYYFVSFLKTIVARPRPFIVMPETHLVISETGFSFPSHHTAIAFMAATILSRFFKDKAVFFIIACLVGFSRVYLGVHYVSDVIAGAIIGFLIGYGLIRISENAASIRE